MEKLPPSKLNRELAKKHYSGNLLIFTMVSGDYQWYIPLFLHCIGQYFSNDVKVIIITREDVASNCMKMSGLSKCRPSGCYTPPDLNKFPHDGYTTAALRFLHEEEDFKKYDYTLITDIDIMMFGEDPDLINQHMRDMEKHHLLCYDNYNSNAPAANSPDTKRKCPGVHFVTREWWDRTREYRNKTAEDLQKTGSPSWEYDEQMLYDMIIKSGLPEPPVVLNMWAHHGVHLGDWRRRVTTRTNLDLRPIGPQVEWIRTLLHDEEFMRLATICDGDAPKLRIRDTLELMRRNITL